MHIFLNFDLRISKKLIKKLFKKKFLLIFCNFYSIGGFTANNAGGLFGPQTQQTSSLFQPSVGGGIFGSSTAAAPQSRPMFGATTTTTAQNFGKISKNSNSDF